jgi:streptogramin lyase
MGGTSRTITRRVLSRLLLGALLIAALSMAPTAAAARRVPRVKSAKTFVLPWNTTSSSVAVGPEGIPWFGTSAPGSLSLVSAQEGTLQIDDLDPNRELVGPDEYGSTSDLRFDAEGNLWFVRSDKTGPTLVRRAPDGAETDFDLPGTQLVSSLTTGPEGGVWFARGAGLGSITPAGAVTQFPLPAKSHPQSIVPGPDGAFWFIEENAGEIGRITPQGQVRFFALGPRVHPRQIVAGADGALWFSENGRPGPDKRLFDRLGRITTSGKVTQFPIRFGDGTEELAADPRGLIWFTTEKGEISSISSAGTVGRRGCVGSCSAPIYSIAVAPEGAIWFAAAKHYKPCLECGGGTALLQQLEGAPVGEIPAGALRPAVGASR